MAGVHLLIIGMYVDAPRSSASHHTYDCERRPFFVPLSLPVSDFATTMATQQGGECSSGDGELTAEFEKPRLLIFEDIVIITYYRLLCEDCE